MLLKQRLPLVLLALYSSLCISQTKDEREVRIDLNDLPKAIKNISDDLPQGIKKPKFYYETDGEHQSYEVKFKYQKKFYSIEIDTLGQIEDIEVETKMKRLNPIVKTNIESYFNNTFKKHKLIKIQKQFVYSGLLRANHFILKVLNESIQTTINYEIIVEVTEPSRRHIREFIFNQDGKFVAFRTLAQPNYGHVLYEN